MEYERVREQIAEFLFNADPRNQAFGLQWEFSDQEYYRKEADKILSLVEIKSDNQSLPELRRLLDLPQYHNKLGSPYSQGQVDTQTDMKEAGFIRVIPKPKRK